MAIYKSSFNKEPDKKEKQPKDKPIKQDKEKKRKVNKPLILLIIFSALFLVCVLPNNFIKSFILGLVGLLIYPVCIIGIMFSIIKLMKKQYIVKTRYVVYLTISLLIIWFIFHLILTSKLDSSSYGTFLKDSYLAKTTAGGLLFSLISYPIVKILTTVGAYIFSIIILAVMIGLIIDCVNQERTIGHSNKKSKFDFQNIADFENVEKPIETISEKERVRLEAKKKLGLEKNESTILSSSMPTLDIDTKLKERKISKRDYILTPIEPVIPTDKSENVFTDDTTGYRPHRPQKSNFDVNVNSSQDNRNVEKIEPKPIIDNLTDKEKVIENDNLSNNEPEYKDIQHTEEYEYNEFIKNDEFNDNTENDIDIETNIDNADNEQEDYDIFEDLDDFVDEDTNTNVETADYENTQTQPKVEEITPNIRVTEYVDNYANNKQDSALASTVDSEVVHPSVDISKFNLPNVIKKSTEPEQVHLEMEQEKQVIPPYNPPPIELLNYIENPERISDEQLQDNIDRLEQVLEDFKVPAKVSNVQVGPAVTRYELTMPRGISVNKIAQMADDIAMTLASNGSIRVEAPIPGKNLVGIEVPNDSVSAVSLRELLDSQEYKVRVNPLSFVLGKDINGNIIFCNLDKMPHVLVAGSTGSGKSVCLNTMLLSMCYKAGPQDLRLILVDPKMVEFSTYNGLPHLLIPEVITGKEMAVNALEWAIREMERRYALFAKYRAVNIVEYNKTEFVRMNNVEKLPYIVIVVDELADLMLEAKREIEDKIAKLAAKARAAGIHLVLATQRPSVDVITGTVKANLPSRIAFALTNYMDSKTVLDGGGAEKLLGKGDMLFKPQDKPEPRRVQGAYVSNAEISKVVEYIKEHNKPVYDDNTGKMIKNPNTQTNSSHDSAPNKDEFDPVLKDALRMFIQTKQASGSMISRRYSVGFNRAGRIMDQMERAGFIGQQEGSKPRQVLITMEEYKAIFGDDED